MLVFRGCLSVGTFYRSPDMIIGPAVDEAAEYFDRSEWSGISTCPSASKILADAEKSNVSLYDFFVQYDIPLKNNEFDRNGWALNWPKSQVNDQTKNVDLKKILYEESVLSNVKVNDTAYSKIENTLAFYDWVFLDKKVNR